MLVSRLSSHRAYSYEHTLTYTQNIDQKELDILQDPDYLARGRHRLPVLRLPHSLAYALLTSHTQQPLNKSQHAALGRLKSAYRIHRTTPELYIKVFNDLSTIVFGGTLHHRVFFAWADLYDHAP